MFLYLLYLYHQNSLCSFYDLYIGRDRQRETTLFYTMIKHIKI
jgi:hypothetical protein